MSVHLLSQQDYKELGDQILGGFIHKQPDVWLARITQAPQSPTVPTRDKSPHLEAYIVACPVAIPNPRPQGGKSSPQAKSQLDTPLGLNLWHLTCGGPLCLVWGFVFGFFVAFP